MILVNFENRIKRTLLMLGGLIMLFIWLNPLFLSAQNYPSRHYTARNGLPSMAIRCVYKDTHGLLWIGTDAGLCTFDGKSFRIFKPSEGMTASQVWAIAEDDQGNMWFGSMGEGLYKFDGRHFKQFTHKEGLVSDRIRVLCWSKNFHCLIAGGYDGVSTIRGDKITASKEWVGNKENLYCVTSIIDVGKFIYITTLGLISPLRFRYYPDKEKFVIMTDKAINPYESILSGYLSSKGDTLFSIQDRGIKIFNKEGTFHTTAIGYVFGITEDSWGDLWLASWGYQGRDLKDGVFRYDGKTLRNYKDQFGITDREIWSVFYDKEQDILWIGTLNEGLFMISFKGITNFGAPYFSLSQQTIDHIFLDSKHTLWIAGNKELIRMAPDGGFSFMEKRPMVLSFRQYWQKSNRKIRALLDSTHHALRKLDASLLSGFEKQTDFRFQYVNEGPDHSLIFSNRFGLFQFSQENQKTDYLGPDCGGDEFAVLGEDTMIYAGWGPTAIDPKFRDKSANISNSSYVRSPLTVFSNVLFTFTDKGDPRNVNHLVKHGNQFWYASFTDGLWMSEGLKLIHFNEIDSTISKNLNYICFDERGHVIFGSNAGEICIASYANRKLKIEYRINSSNGLQGNSISWLMADQKGKLWVGTNLGLNCIGLDSLYRSNKQDIRFIDEEEGYTGQSSKTAVMDANGLFWIGGDDQLLRFDTKDFFSLKAGSGRVILKSIEINNTPADSLLKKGLDLLTSLEKDKCMLKHSENDLAFNYDIINYSNPQKDRFRYMLRGYDKTWFNWSATRRVAYTNLPPGQYTFLVESSNLFNPVKGIPLEVKFTIRHPWWGLWYLQLLAFVFLLSLLAVMIRKYMETERNKERQKSEVEKKIVQLEMQALQAQMNPHFIFNCMNGIQYYILANKMDEALTYLSDFSKVVRESLGNATIRMISLEQEINFLTSYLRLEKMRFPDKFDYTIRCIDFEPDDNVSIPPMLVQPYAENAVRHGFEYFTGKGRLSIVFEKGGSNLLKCTITDNGIGREKSNIKGGATPINDRPHSTMITETRMRLFNPPGSPAKYKIVYNDLSENGNSCGLRVELYLPMETGSSED